MFRLRAHLRRLSPELAKSADHLWTKARPVHERQNRETSLTENGAKHVLKVEDNIWRLATNDGKETKKFLRLFKNNSFPLFVLTGAACCHDFDKAIPNPPSGFVHGEGSADFIEKNKGELGLSDPQCSAIQKAIRIHDKKNKNEEFQKSLIELTTKEAGPDGDYNLRLIATLLKAADILHMDHSRIVTIAILSPDNLVEKERGKYLSRKAVTGWYPDGTRIVFKADPKTPDEANSVNEAFEYMQSEEWPCVRTALEMYGLPFELSLSSTWEHPVPKEETKSTHIASLNDVINWGWNKEKLLDALIKLDCRAIEGLNGNTAHEGTVQQWGPVFWENPNTWKLLIPQFNEEVHHQAGGYAWCLWARSINSWEQRNEIGSS